MKLFLGLCVAFSFSYVESMKFQYVPLHLVSPCIINNVDTVVFRLHTVVEGFLHEKRSVWWRMAMVEYVNGDHLEVTDHVAGIKDLFLRKFNHDVQKAAVRDMLVRALMQYDESMNYFLHELLISSFDALRTRRVMIPMNLEVLKAIIIFIEQLPEHCTDDAYVEGLADGLQHETVFTTLKSRLASEQEEEKEFVLVEESLTTRLCTLDDLLCNGDQELNTLLHWAARYGLFDIVNFLIEKISPSKKTCFIRLTNVDDKTAEMLVPTSLQESFTNAMQRSVNPRRSCSSE